MTEIENKNTSLEMEAYLDAIEQYAQKKFLYRSEIGVLIRLSQQMGLWNEFEELIFLSKFISNAHSILRRAGSESSETIKLAAEYQKSIEKSSDLLKGLLKAVPEDVQNNFENKFLSVSHSGLANLLALLYELSWIKNYSLDKK